MKAVFLLKKTPFIITEALFEQYQQDARSLTISNIAAKLNSLAKINGLFNQKISYQEIRDWFMQEDFLSKAKSSEGKEFYTPTEKGSNYGIYFDERVSSRGNTYQVLMYSVDAQIEFLKNTMP